MGSGTMNSNESLKDLSVEEHHSHQRSETEKSSASHAFAHTGACALAAACSLVVSLHQTASPTSPKTQASPLPVLLPSQCVKMLLSGEHDLHVVRRARLNDEEHEANGVIVSVQDIVDEDPEWRESRSNRDAAAPSRAKAPKKKKQRVGDGANKILFLDGVRGLAAILVVSRHAKYLGDINMGACGVDIFFVLSSFLLSMLFAKKSQKLIEQQASYRKWFFTLVDYFLKRFMRVYPLFVITAVVVSKLSLENQVIYWKNKRGEYDLYKVLTFDSKSRFHVFWTLPLEISYYIMIPVFVFGVIRLGRAWWMPFIPLYIWVVNAGLHNVRKDHMPLAPHITTFVAGSMAAIIFVKLEAAIKRNSFEFRWWHTVLVRTVEYCASGLLLSLCFDGLFFHWIHENPVRRGDGAPFISLQVTMVIVIEMILPSCISRFFEWNFLVHWGKVSFSAYLLHSFVVYNAGIHNQGNYYDRLFSQYGLVLLLGTASYHVVEHPLQLLTQRISRGLARLEGRTAQVPYTPVPKLKNGHDDASTA